MMTLPTKHRMRNLWPNNMKSLRMSGEETLVSLKPDCQGVGRTRDLWLSTQTALYIAPEHSIRINYFIFCWDCHFYHPICQIVMNISNIPLKKGFCLSMLIQVVSTREKRTSNRGFDSWMAELRRISLTCWENTKETNRDVALVT